MRLLVTASTDVGRVRKSNEDSYCILENLSSAYLCDGMGGHVAGAQASHFAIDTLTKTHTHLNDDKLKALDAEFQPTLPIFARRMIHAIRLANLRIYNISQNRSELQGMGTTIVGISLSEGISCIAHVGDSRAYRIRDKKIIQMTEDHSWLNELIHAGKLNKENIKNFPHRNVIIRALGIENTVKIDIRLDPVKEDDYFLLCSDGLHDLISDETIMNTVLAYEDDVEDAIKALIFKANKAGGKDNITIALMKVTQLDAPAVQHNFHDTVAEESTSQLAIEYRLLTDLFGVDESEAETRPININR
ncbi:Stp1/IreP family PP2C-type Ser/Thr phosphatase [candidate division KSB1 bacterium]|nr:Stp1/IreP family PP2C-type Ser/Thr phosphatase [candidate division KSB1 bacterium]